MSRLMKEIVIEIRDEVYERLLKPNEPMDYTTAMNVRYAIKNGKVLPKGHGELKDTNEILAKTYVMQKDLESNNDRIWAINKPKYKALAYANRFILDAPTLVEADKGDTE